MKKYLGILLIIGFVVSGCASSDVVKNSYKVLGMSGIGYDVGMTSAAEFQGRGLITTEQRAKIDKEAENFYVVYHEAVDSLKAYAVAPPEQKEDKLMNLQLITQSVLRVYDKLLLVLGVYDIEIEKIE